MPKLPRVIILAVAFSLSACGSSDEAGSGDKSASTDTSKSVPASRDSRKDAAKINCDDLKKANGKKDIVGLKLGMSFDQARAVMMCAGQNLAFEYGKVWHVKNTQGIDTRQLARVTNGVLCQGRELLYSSECLDFRISGFQPRKEATHEIYVAFNGLPGKEKVGAVWRTLKYKEGKRPPTENVVNALKAKYGKPNFTKHSGRREQLLGWVLDKRGRPMSPKRPGFHTCSQGVEPRFQGNHSWSAACGFGLTASITPNYSNPLVVDEISVSMMDQGAFIKETKSFKAALAKKAKADKQAELDAARKNSPDVDL